MHRRQLTQHKQSRTLMALLIKGIFVAELDTRLISEAQLEKLLISLENALDGIPATVLIDGQPITLKLACKHVKGEKV